MTNGNLKKLNVYLAQRMIESGENTTRTIKSYAK